jgi:predicted RNase H-like nuclease
VAGDVFNDLVGDPGDQARASVTDALRAVGRAVLWVDGWVDAALTRVAELGSGAGDGGPAVLGVDGCRAGWVGGVWDGRTATVSVGGTVGDLVANVRAEHPGLAVVGIDIPIGLADTGPRRADLLARGRLPAGRKSSVFPAPARAATGATTHPEASAANRDATGVGLSIQAFHLLPKILEVDAYVRSPRSCRVVEVHPEVSFAAMDAACVVPSKRTPAGAAARVSALRAAGLEPPAYAPGHGYAADDLLDACAAAWTALRVAHGDHETLPDPPDVFSDGLPAAIWV